MSTDRNDVVKVARGETVEIELYKQALADAGIEARVLGEILDSSLGTALQNSVELWVHRSDAVRAEEVIRQMQAERGQAIPPERTEFPRPVSDPKPPQPGGRKPHTHYDADPHR